MTVCYQKSKNYFQSHRPFQKPVVYSFFSIIWLAEFYKQNHSNYQRSYYQKIDGQSYKLMNKLLLKVCWSIISFCMLWSNSNCSFTLVVILSWKKFSQNYNSVQFHWCIFWGSIFLLYLSIMKAVWNGKSFLKSKYFNIPLSIRY